MWLSHELLPRGLRRIEMVPTSIVEETKCFKCMYCCEFYRLMSLV
ncbi:hypothetical protein AtNW77_Chr1g0034901 [Arabidopsis thaliana]